MTNAKARQLLRCGASGIHHPRRGMLQAEAACLLEGPEGKELGISKWMKVRLISTLTCTLLQLQKEGRVVVTRRRLTVVLLTAPMTLFTKL
mmetsp:Transcript_89014/g.177088  ORF Transcript_89014/g.177088 Transcript_89014/m.177088 type:complete len:91 (+) Transcript_89014:186-458(+)